ncbi:MAG: YeiH family protein [Bdellovibrionota bacterium]
MPYAFVSSGSALLLGVALALCIGNPYVELTRKWTHKFLAISVVGLGAGMNLGVIGKVGIQGVGYTVIGIIAALSLGTMLGKILRTPSDTSLLISVGTAICGGSAIAAVAPVIRAKHHEVSVALGIVFMLNGLALFLFPAVGHFYALSEGQFGLWCALAIHDTSSVVGATLQYGPHALEVGTTIKLARALWIIPLAFAIGIFRARNPQEQVGAGKGKKPWFILGFLVAAAIFTIFPSLQAAGHEVEAVAKRVLVLTLFLIGSNLTKATLKSVGFKPFVQGILLWLVVAGASLAAVISGWARI